MKFNSSSTTITVLDEYIEDFTQYMAERVPDLKKWLSNKKLAVPIAVECAIRDHAEWFEFSFYKFKRESKYYEFNPEFIVREQITQGMTYMEVIA